jgi:hypothetical protein
MTTDEKMGAEMHPITLNPSRDPTFLKILLSIARGEKTHFLKIWIEHKQVHIFLLFIYI